MWPADNEVTLGCNPPTTKQFYLDDKVTREQMPAFMRRLAQTFDNTRAKVNKVGGIIVETTTYVFRVDKAAAGDPDAAAAQRELTATWSTTA